MNTLRFELEVEDCEGVKSGELESTELPAILAELRTITGLDDLYVFECGRNAVIGEEIKGKRVVALHAHRVKEVLVKVRYEHLEKKHHFATGERIYSVLLWAVGTHGYNLDDNAKAKAHLILPDGTQPLPKDDVIGRLVKFCGREHHHELVLDLTLKDFTNG